MTFVCTVTQGGFRIQVFRAGVSGIAVISIGHDDVEPLNYSAVVGFDVLPGDQSELFFHIVEAESDTGSEHVYWSGRETGFVADPVDRETILVSVLSGLKSLLPIIDPDEFVWFTYDEDLPAKALLKFGAIRQTIERAGYAVTSTELDDGRWAWEAKRNTDVIDNEGAYPNPIDLRE